MKNLLPIYPAGVDTGMVIDCGYLMTEISCIIQSQFSIKGLKGCYQGGSIFDQHLKNLIIEDNKWEAEEDIKKLDFEFLQDIKSRVLRVLTLE